jgi:hypothetical protein
MVRAHSSKGLSTLGNVLRGGLSRLAVCDSHARAQSGTVSGTSWPQHWLCTKITERHFKSLYLTCDKFGDSLTVRNSQKERKSHW